MEKRCPTCKKIKTAEKFYKNKTIPGGLDRYCIECKKAKHHKVIQHDGRDRFVYIISHPKFLGWVKLGRAVDPLDRIKQYQTGCPFREYKLEFFMKVKDQRFYEKYFEEHFEHKNEWFKMEVDSAISILQLLFERENKN